MLSWPASGDSNARAVVAPNNHFRQVTVVRLSHPFALYPDRHKKLMNSCRPLRAKLKKEPKVMSPRIQNSGLRRYAAGVSCCILFVILLGAIVTGSAPDVPATVLSIHRMAAF